MEYTDNPRLKNQNDLHYSGCGCTWGIDLDGKRFWKLYIPSVIGHTHFNYGDFINEKARIKTLREECSLDMDRKV